ncbi:transposase [Mycobacterium kyorinense]|uniref:Transposase n=1 Tax=Mycobacterium kyorinense TaxID=487514 RepID=A0A1X1YAX9_9MYCO|nr:transposase [Mycobacterium kyorinense]ORW08174.1 transposase [Mycobacterium kyorinense]
MTVSSRSTDGLRASAEKRRQEARAKIKKALREMKKKGLTINPNAVARHADVARKTIYNHRDLLNEVRAAQTAPRPTPTPLQAPTSGETSITTALRDQLRAQKARYETDTAALKSTIKQLQGELAATHGELHRLRNTSGQPRRGTP